MAQRYIAPDWFTRNVFNPSLAALTRLGISVWGSRILEVRGRKTGRARRVPVNLLTLAGGEVLAPRGHTQWVGNPACRRRRRALARQAARTLCRRRNRGGRQGADSARVS